MGWLQALLAGLCYLIWCWPPWGYLMCLGKYEPEGRDISYFESTCLVAANGNFPEALAVRHVVCLIPAMAVLGPFALLVGLFAPVSYGIGWTWTPAAPIRTGELLMGALWGVLLVLHW